MTKRKNVVSKMLLLVLILTLISCCFLGSTFARYTSSGNGSATLNVAKWAIDIKGGAIEGGMSVNFAEKLSPSKHDYNTTVDGEYTANTVRSILRENCLLLQSTIPEMWRHWLLLQREK